MTYDSPKQIRRRQQAAENKVSRRRQAQPVKVMTDEQWNHACDAMLFRLDSLTWQRQADSAGRCGQALVHMAIQRRACELMRDFGPLSVLGAMAQARIQLLGEEPL